MQRISGPRYTRKEYAVLEGEITVKSCLRETSTCHIVRNAIHMQDDRPLEIRLTNTPTVVVRATGSPLAHATAATASKSPRRPRSIAYTLSLYVFAQGVRVLLFQPALYRQVYRGVVRKDAMRTRSAYPAAMKGAAGAALVRRLFLCHL